jgi:hypothetical protein
MERCGTVLMTGGLYDASLFMWLLFSWFLRLRSLLLVADTTIS